MTTTATIMNERYTVEICATLLVDKPPKLPLREEVMSLGFEIIYNADGIGDEVAVMEAERAVERFRREEEYREAKKIRIFPRSAKRIKLKEEIRKQKEDELRAPHAFSYESYEHELYSHSTSFESPSGDAMDKFMLSKSQTEESAVSTLSPKSSRFRAVVRARRMKSLGWFRKGKSSDEKQEGPAGVSLLPLNQKPSTDDVFAKAGFRDILMSARSLETELTSAHSGMHSATTRGSTAPSNANTSISTRLGDTIQNMEIQFVSSQIADKYLPELNTVQESNDLDADNELEGATKRAGNLDNEVKNAFAGVGPVEDAFADLPTSSSLYQTASNVEKKSQTDSPVAETDKSKPSNPWLSSALNYYKEKPSSSTRTDAAKDAPAGNQDSDAVDDEAVEAKIEADLVQFARSYESVGTLFESLIQTTTTLAQIEEILTKDPELLQVKQHDTGHFPLHTLCLRPMPDRQEESVDVLTDNLVKDVSDFKNLVELIVGFYPDACTFADKKGDLAVHLAARALMEWEATWYERVYGEAAQENDSAGKTTDAISKLYQSMSECIEILLRPISATPELCCKPGSVGEILPLHIASIFTATVRTLRTVLEANPQAAGIPCKLGELTTFVPDNFLALQLHEELSTDFPKWEIETTADSDPNMKWSRSPASAQDEAADRIKRSDLIFAYYPHIEPNRFEKTRIRNLESLVHFEASQLISGSATGLSKASQRLWKWMCMFTEPETNRATYVNSVQRVLDGLPFQSVKYLASMKTNTGEQLINEAATDCSTVIRRRLRELEATTVSFSCSYNYRSWEEKQWGRLFQALRGQIALSCRSIFNIESGAFPTTFVILPYELSQNVDGSLGMADPAAVKVAVKFAECLLQLTEPKSLMHFLDEKSTKHFEQFLVDSPAADDAEARIIRERIEQYKANLIALYDAQPHAYFYLIDEASGTPVVTAKDSTIPSAYPIMLREPGSMVQKLFPSMLVGMTLMRGPRALSVLMDVLLDESVTAVPPTWLDTAADFIGILDEEKLFGEAVKDAIDLKDDLSTFTSSATRKLKRAAKPSNGSSEWSVERSVIKMLLEIHDKQFTFAGLSAQSNNESGLLWTQESSRNDDEEPQIRRSNSMPAVTSDLGGSRDEENSHSAGLASIYSTRSFDLDERDSASFSDALPHLKSTDTAVDRPTKSAKKIRKTVEKKKQIKRSASVDSARRAAANEKERSSRRSRSEDAHKHKQSKQSKRAKESAEDKKSHSIPPKSKSNQGTEGRRAEDRERSRSKSPRRSKSPKKGKKKQDRVAVTTCLLQDRNWTNAPGGRYSKKPDLSEVSKKFEELTKKHVDMGHVYLGKSSAETGNEPHEDRQPDNEREDHFNEPYVIDLTSMRTPSTAERPEWSTSAEDIILLQSDGNTSSAATNNWDDSKAGDLLSRTRTLVARANRRSGETYWGRRQEKEYRHKHSMLFDEFAFDVTSSEDAYDLRDREEPTARQGTFESTRIWHDLTNQLDANTYIEDHQVLMLKVRLAEEAKRMAKMGKQIDGVVRQEIMAGDRQAELFGKPSAQEEGDFYDTTHGLSRTRRLLIRLCDLEDRLLCDDIDIQHLSLEVLSIDLKVDEIQAETDETSPAHEIRRAFIPPNEIRIHSSGSNLR